MNRDEARGGRRTTATRQLRKPAGGRSQTPDPAAIAWPSVSSLADSVACAMSEKRRNAKLRAEQKAEKVAEMKADLLRMYEECKQAGVVVEVGTGDMPAGLHRHASECLASGSRRGASLDILPVRRSPDAHEDLEGQSHSTTLKLSAFTVTKLLAPIFHASFGSSAHYLGGPTRRGMAWGMLLQRDPPHSVMLLIACLPIDRYETWLLVFHLTSMEPVGL